MAFFYIFVEVKLKTQHIMSTLLTTVLKIPVRTIEQIEPLIFIGFCIGLIWVCTRAVKDKEGDNE